MTNMRYGRFLPFQIDSVPFLGSAEFVVLDKGKNTPLSKSEWKRYRPIEKGIRCSSLSTFPSSSRNLSGLNSSPFSQWLPCSHFVNDLAGCDKVN